MKDLSVSFEKDYANRKITVSYAFNASADVVWDAFTNPKTLDKWFAPEPYQAVTKLMEFENGGRWLYYMLSPKGEKHWCVCVFENIRTNTSFMASDAFCDEQGTVNTDLPQMTWHYEFLENNGTTHVTAVITSANEEDMKQILEMGFEEGYKMGLNQLNKLLHSKS